MLRRLFLLVCILVLLPVAADEPVSLEYLNALLDVSEDGQLIAVSGQIVPDETSRTGSRFPIDFYDAESGLLSGEFAESEDVISGFEFNPQGTLLAYSNNNGRFGVIEVETGDELAVIVQGGFTDIGSSRWSADGSLLSVFQGRGLMLFETENFTPVGGFIDEMSTEVYGFDWSVNDHIAISTRNFDTNEGMIAVWDVSTPEEPTLIKHLFVPGGLAIVWSPDGEKIISSTIGGMLEVTVDDESERIFSMENEDDAIMSLAWSPDGDFIAGGGLHAVYLWDADSADLIGTYEVETTVYRVDWSADGQSVYHSGGSPRVYRLDVAVDE